MKNEWRNSSPSEDSADGVSAEKHALWEIRQRYQIPSNNGKTPPPPRNTVSSSGSKRRPSRPRKSSSRWGRKVLLILVVFSLIGGALFSYKVLSASNKISTADRSILGQLSDLLFSSNQKLEGEKDDRINVLLLAVGGEGHSGESLADTVMLASIRPSDKSVGLLSIPRDLYVQVPGEEYYSKINAVHAYGEAKKKDNGPAVLSEKVQEITGQPIHYFVRLDFVAFKHIVDAVGGIDVKIENSFFDYWHKISFPAGTEHMNGERSLAYVRARYIEGPEGGDFKRASRQQQVLLSLRDKVFSIQTALDFTALNSIMDSLSDNIRTNLQLWEMRRFYELVRSIDHGNVHSTVLTTGPKGVLVGSTEILGGTPAAVLRPRTGDFAEIQALAANIFSQKTLQPTTENTSSTSPTPEASKEPTPVPEKATIEIRNGTTVTGLAQRAKDALTKEGYSVTAIGNATNRSATKTTVYTLNLTHADEAKKIAEILNAQADSGLPKDEAKTEADILIILGTDSQKQ